MARYLIPQYSLQIIPTQLLYIKPIDLSPIYFMAVMVRNSKAMVLLNNMKSTCTHCSALFVRLFASLLTTSSHIIIYLCILLKGKASVQHLYYTYLSKHTDTKITCVGIEFVFPDFYFDVLNRKWRLLKMWPTTCLSTKGVGLRVYCKKS